MNIEHLDSNIDKYLDRQIIRQVDNQIGRESERLKKRQVEKEAGSEIDLKRKRQINVLPGYPARGETKGLEKCGLHVHIDKIDRQTGKFYKSPH